jgi:eukaryotic-like serine/threonine-protein kinase
LTPPDAEEAGQAEDGPVSGERYGDYEVIKPLASGGMADIFLARKFGVQGFQKLVVIKRIRRELVKDEQLIHMFIDEAHVAAKLDHPNVVVISDLGEIDDSYFMAMEYLRGQTLRHLQKRITDLGKMLPPSFWVRIMEYALDGLHYAHELRSDDGSLMGLVHRDFTPSNIMITYTGTVKVIDFGVAHVEAPTRHETKVGTIKGKIAYMSPEQCRGTTVVDRRTDVFAAGIVLWELLSRRQLFNGPSDTAILVEILQGEIPPPGWQGQPVDYELSNIVMKALQRDVNTRFQTAAEMRDALRDYLRRRGEKVDASDISEVMKQLFDAERMADERMANSGRIETGSRSNPNRRPQDSSVSGVSRAGSKSVSKSTAGSARGQKLETAMVQAAAPKSRAGLVLVALLVVGGGAGFGIWQYLKSQQAQMAALQHEQEMLQQQQQQQYQHPPNIPRPENPPPKPEEKKPEETAKPEEKVAENPTEKSPHHTTKNTAPSEQTGGSGSLDFDTRPYTSVFIGKKKIGDTPILGAKVPAGKLTLTLINDEAGIHETFTVTVPKDGHVFKKLKL